MYIVCIISVSKEVHVKGIMQIRYRQKYHLSYRPIQENVV